MEGFAEAIRLNIKNGDLLFVNANVVDVEAMAKHPFFYDRERPTDFLVVPVYVPAGMKLQDCLVVANETTQEKTQ
jgi:hypothetical protein